MTAPEVLARLASFGLRLRLEEGKLVASPRDHLTDKHRDLIRANKVELLEYLGTLDRLLYRVAERYAWSAEDVAEARRGCRRDPVAYREMFVSWLAEQVRGLEAPARKQ